MSHFLILQIWETFSTAWFIKIPSILFLLNVYGVGFFFNSNLMGTPYSNTVKTDGCRGTANEVNYVEHVQAKLTLHYYRRGNLVIHLTSPSGTRSTLLPKRPSDMNKGGFNQWAFLSVHFWEENPSGNWKLEIMDDHPQASWPRPPAGVKGG